MGVRERPRRVWDPGPGGGEQLERRRGRVPKGGEEDAPSAARRRVRAGAEAGASVATYIHDNLSETKMNQEILVHIISWSC